MQQLLDVHHIEYETEIPPAAGAQDVEEEAPEVAAAVRDHGLTCMVTEQKKHPMDCKMSHVVESVKKGS